MISTKIWETLLNLDLVGFLVENPTLGWQLHHRIGEDAKSIVVLMQNSSWFLFHNALPRWWTSLVRCANLLQALKKNHIGTRLRIMAGFLHGSWIFFQSFLHWSFEGWFLVIPPKKKQQGHVLFILAWSACSGWPHENPETYHVFYVSFGCVTEPFLFSVVLATIEIIISAQLSAVQRSGKLASRKGNLHSPKVVDRGSTNLWESSWISETRKKTYHNILSRLQYLFISLRVAFFTGPLLPSQSHHIPYHVTAKSQKPIKIHEYYKVRHVRCWLFSAKCWAFQFRVVKQSWHMPGAKRTAAKSWKWKHHWHCETLRSNYGSR